MGKYPYGVETHILDSLSKMSIGKKLIVINEELNLIGTNSKSN